MRFRKLKKQWNKWFETKKQHQPALLTTDCLHLVLAQLPLAEQLTTAQRVNRQWATSVKELCSAQKSLTLQIGRKNENWADIYLGIRCNKRQLLQSAVSPLHTLTFLQLSEEKRITYLISTFPRLKTLAVIVSNNSAEDVHFLRHLPGLIAAYADSLTTLQLVWNVVENAAAPSFQAIFTQLIASIDGLRRLQRLSFYDYNSNLAVPSFDLPRLLLLGTSFSSSPLRRLDFIAFKASPQVAHQWAASLQSARGGRSTTQSNSDSGDVTPQRLLAINYHVFDVKQETSLLRQLPADAAAHFCSLSAFIEDNEAVHFRHFSQLKTLNLKLSCDLSLDRVLPLLASEHLPHLTHLDMAVHNQSVRKYSDHDDDDDDVALHHPVLASLSTLSLHLYGPLQHAFFSKMLRPLKIFPKLAEVNLYLSSNYCRSCGWEVVVKEEGGRRGSQSRKLKAFDAQAVVQCVTLLGATFCKPSLEMYVAVSEMNKRYWIDFDSDKQMKLTLISKKKRGKQNLMLPFLEKFLHFNISAS